MRDELKNFDWHLYGLNPGDFDYTFSIVENAIKERRALLDKQYEEDEPPNKDDAYDDLFYYNYIENMYLWTFCLWRLQGIFEGLMTTRYLRLAKHSHGLKAKLHAMKKQGFPLSEEDERAIIEWAKLRNALSHCPPEMYTPCRLSEDDVLEYLQLLKRIVADWEEQLRR